MAWDARHPLPHDLDLRMRFDRLGYPAREANAIHGERLASGYGRRVRHTDHEGSEPPHLFLEQANGIPQRIGTQ